MLIIYSAPSPVSAYVYYQQKTEETLLNADVPLSELISWSADDSVYYSSAKKILPNGTTHFSFNFLPYTTSLGNITYQSRIMGMDDKWSEPTKSTSYTYYLNKAGSYAFQIRTTGSSDNWGEPLTIPFEIKPPFWLSWWAYGGYFIVISLVILAGFYIRPLVLHKRNQRWAEQVSSITAKLTEANNQQKVEISRRIAIEKELIKKVNELEILIKNKGKLYSLISHDLKTPFNSILGFTRVMIDEFDSYTEYEKKEMIQHINHSAEKLLEQLENMLEWARIQTGNLKFEPQKLVLDDTVKCVLKLLNDTAADKKLNIRYNGSENVTAIADSNMLKSIIQNLISNAIKFTEPGGNIVVEVLQVGKDLRLRVTDSGVGITEQDQQYLFQENHITSTIGTQDEKGAGIGLKLCMEMIALHKGEISVESEVGVGTAFTVTLPDIIITKEEIAEC